MKSENKVVGKSNLVSQDNLSQEHEESQNDINNSVGTDFYFTEEKEELFKQVDRACIACHGNSWEGGLGPSLINLNKKYNESEIMEIIMNGKGVMPGE